MEKQPICSHPLYWGDELKPCGQPINKSDTSPSGYEHTYQVDPRGQHVDWQHQAKP